jgi:hypothetical protein
VNQVKLHEVAMPGERLPISRKFQIDQAIDRSSWSMFTWNPFGISKS